MRRESLYTRMIAHLHATPYGRNCTRQMKKQIASARHWSLHCGLMRIPHERFAVSFCVFVSSLALRWRENECAGNTELNIEAWYKRAYRADTRGIFCIYDICINIQHICCTCCTILLRARLRPARLANNKPLKYCILHSANACVLQNVLRWRAGVACMPFST